MSATVLVTDGDQRSSLAVVRSLGRAGHRCFVCSEARRSLAGASRFATASERVPPAATDPDGFVGEVERLIAEWDVDVLLPMTDGALLRLLPRKEVLEGVFIPFPDLATFRAVSDKATMMETARRVGIAVPDQRTLTRRPSAPRKATEGLRFPLVVKPARSVTAGSGRLDSFTVSHAGSPEELASVLDRLPEAAYPVLVQEFVSGPGVGIFLLIWNGEPVATFAHRRIREKPPSGGVSVYRESVEADPALVSSSVELLKAHGWEGVAMVEYKLDTASGTPFLMEVNGRFWGSLQLAVDAGVDFPRLLVEAATGHRPPPTRDYATGVRTRWLWGDVDHLFLRLKDSGRYERFLSPRSGRVGAIIDFLAAFGPGSRDEVLDPRDPGPFVRESADRLAGLFGRSWRRRGPSLVPPRTGA